MSHRVGSSARSSGAMDGQAGGILASGNPTAERRLAATLKKIDREKKKRESAMVWNQRSFFIRQVFDQDNDLRFVKAARRPKYLENIPPPPPDGDREWEKDEYVFSFKPRSSASQNNRNHLGRQRSKDILEEVSKAPESDAEGEEVAAEQPAQEASSEEARAKEDAEEQARRAEEELIEKEKRDRSMGVFGTRREKLKMPVLMMGGVKTKSEDGPTENEEKSVEESSSAEPEQKREQAEPLPIKCDSAVDKNTAEDSGEKSKPKVRFPVLKVRALGLFAMNFKKSDSFPSLQSPKQSQTQVSQDSASLVSSLPPTAGSVVTAAVPPRPALADMQPPRPGSISLPNSPLTERKPIVRQKSANSIQLDGPKTDQPRISPLKAATSDVHRRSRRGSKRDVASQAGSRQRRSSSSDKAKVSTTTSALPRVKRKESIDQTSQVNIGQESVNIWAKIPENSESRNRGEENKDGSIRVDDIEGDSQNDEIDVQVIRRIIRTLPTNLMMKTSKREAEAGGEYALMRQRLMDRARADMMRKAALDPRFTKLEKSLSNTAQN